MGRKESNQTNSTDQSFSGERPRVQGPSCLLTHCNETKLFHFYTIFQNEGA